MKKICLLTLILLLLGIFYIGYRYSTLYNEYAKVRNELKILNDEIVIKSFGDAVKYVSTSFIKEDFLKVALYSNASNYFCMASNNNLIKLNKNSSVCSLWTDETKDMYRNIYLEYYDDVNQTLKKQLTCTLQGIEIVDNVCLNK